ncbi:hypothetical protein B296_00002912 [Ensete ventricosum]|uniref:Uncharacterized protein n=1 Tax=Ensete ventricosum TaxID=4639 RepID=A0A427AZR2_ENSVE|nr:hypothetical protein B296_00002912 [Ensete ventricosum]
MEVSPKCGERLPTGKSVGASEAEEEDIEEPIVALLREPTLPKEAATVKSEHPTPYSARQFEVIVGAEVARHTRKQSEGGGSMQGEAALVHGDATMMSTFGLLIGDAGRVKRFQ